MEKSAKRKDATCKYPHSNLWCVSVMAAAIIILTWLPSFSQMWSRIVITILAALVFIRSMVVNCCK